MKKIKAFTLTELIVTLTTLMLIIAMLAPVLKNKIPDLDKGKLKQAYGQVLTVVDLLINDYNMYPNSLGFAYTEVATNSISGEAFGGPNKFAELFMSKLNLNGEAFDLSTKGKTQVPTYCDQSASGATCIVNNAKNANKCFTTTNNITYCVPYNTTLFWNANDVYSHAYVGVIRIFLDSNNMQDKDGYYLALNAKGEVSVLPTKSAFKNRVDCGAADSIKNPKSDYNTYKHCKTNDFLLEGNALK